MVSIRLHPITTHTYVIKLRLQNGDIRAELKVKEILQLMEEMQLKWYYMYKGCLMTHRLLNWMPNTTRFHGRPQKH